MGNTKSQETIIAQNGEGNSASVQQLQYHVSVTNVLLMIIVMFLCLGGCFKLMKLYKKCHQQQIRREINARSVMMLKPVGDRRPPEEVLRV